MIPGGAGDGCTSPNCDSSKAAETKICEEIYLFHSAETKDVRKALSQKNPCAAAGRQVLIALHRAYQTFDVQALNERCNLDHRFLYILGQDGDDLHLVPVAVGRPLQ